MQRKLHLLPDLIVLVVGLSKWNGSAIAIAQFALGNLAFKSLIHHCIYSSLAILKMLWDWGQYFDTGPHLSGICIYVTNAPFYLYVLYYPIALLIIQM